MQKDVESIVILEVYFAMDLIFLLRVLTGCTIIDGIVDTHFKSFFNKRGVLILILQT